jgi:hypothetical protein
MAIAEIKKPGVAQLAARQLWERVTPPAIRKNPKSRNSLQTLAFWCFIPSAKTPKTAV